MTNTFNTSDYITILNNSTSSFNTSTGNTISITNIQERLDDLSNKLYPEKITTTRDINPRLYFKFVKSKLTKIQQEKLKERIKKLTSFIKYAQETDQLALYEESSKQILQCIKEQEIDILGVHHYVSKDLIEKFINKVRDKVIKFKQLSEFPRIIPVNVRKKLKTLQNKNLFDEYWIVYTDYTPAKEEIKSTKQKIIEKDPILFGRLNISSDKFYFIADWEDEYCDLTFDKLVEASSKFESDFSLPTISKIDDKYIEKLKREIEDRKEKLKNTNRSNFKDLARSETTKVSWFKRWFNF